MLGPHSVEAKIKEGISCFQSYFSRSVGIALIIEPSQHTGMQVHK